MPLFFWILFVEILIKAKKMKIRTLITLLISLVIFTSCSSSKYVNYLKEHTEVIKMKDTLWFNSLDTNFYQNKLFLLGEVHEVETSPRN